MKKIPLIKPVVTDPLKERVLEVLDSGFWTEGPITREFEKAIAEFTGARHVLATTSCTTGLELALRCLGIGPGDEVVVPDYTYPATASVVNIVGATAVLVDVDPGTLLVDYAAMEAAITGKTRALMPVSLFGAPLDWHRINEIKRRHEVLVIEDAACALGSSFTGQMTGTFADITVFSHHPRKLIATGEGGTVCTDDDVLAAWMQSYKHFGLLVEEGRLGADFIRPGTNYKLSDLLAAVGLEQMKLISQLLAQRRLLAQQYQQLLKSLPGVQFPSVHPEANHSWQTFCILIEDRNRVMTELRAQGIEVQIGTYALHMHKAFQESDLCRIQGSLRGSQQAFDQALALPLFHDMTGEQQLQVVSALTEAMGSRR